MSEIEAPVEHTTRLALAEKSKVEADYAGVMDLDGGLGSQLGRVQPIAERLHQL